ncbi:hypothetical protein C8R45DRAFT_1097966 [Mycena sanguinolenta]|nr:hypothetical protein C8R45DRAFT_1097966 [Mycena sanguinolenta]
MPIVSFQFVGLALEDLRVPVLRFELALELPDESIGEVYEARTAAQAEQRSQIGALHSQVQELRRVLDDAEADRGLLQKARRALQAELEVISKSSTVGNSSQAADGRKIQLKQLDIERALEEQEYRASDALDRMKKAEAYANQCQVELGRVKVDSSELDRLNANLEKQVKELHARIAELETKPLISPRPAARRESRIEELQNQLQTNKGPGRR